LILKTKTHLRLVAVAELFQKCFLNYFEDEKNLISGDVVLEMVSKLLAGFEEEKD